MKTRYACFRPYNFSSINCNWKVQEIGLFAYDALSSSDYVASINRMMHMAALSKV